MTDITKGNAHKQPSGILRHLPGLIAVAFWGMSFVSTGIIMDKGGLSPTEAYIYRFTLAYIFVALLSHKRWLCNNWRDEGLMLLCGMSSGSLYFIAENTALTMTMDVNVSLLTSTSPLITLLIVGLLYKSERPGLGLIIGSLIAFAGVICVIFNSVLQSGSEGVKISPAGDMLALGASLLWALYSLMLKRLNVVYDSMFITRKTFFYGVITAIPFLLLTPGEIHPLVVFENKLVLFNLLFLVGGASILGFYLWSLSIEKVGPVVSNNYMYFQPVVTLIGSFLILGTPIFLLGVIGLVLVLFGLWFGDFLQERLTRRAALKGKQRA